MQETQVQSLGWEDSPEVGNGNPLQYSCLENPMDRGAWWAIYTSWGNKESDMAKRLTATEQAHIFQNQLFQILPRKIEKKKKKPAGTALICRFKVIPIRIQHL